MRTRPYLLALAALSVAALSVATPALAQKPPAPITGRLAPETVFEHMIQAPDGAPLNIAELQGKVVALNFWATWCRPCIDSIPRYNAIVEQYEDDIVFIAVTSEPPEKVEPLLEKLGMRAWIACDTDSSVFRNYNVNQLPYGVVIDAFGVVADFESLGGLDTEDLDRIIRGERVKFSSGENRTIHAGAFDWEIGFDAGMRRADIQPSSVHEAIGLAKQDGGFTAMAHTVHGLAMWAWDADRSRVLVEGFDDPRNDRFDVAINIPGGNESDVKSELRALLQNRLNVRIGWEEREVETLVLRRIDGVPHKLREEDRYIGDVEDENTSVAHFGELEKNYIWRNRTVTGDRIEALREFIELYAWRPVFDETGLEGFYTWTLELAMTDTQDKAPIVECELGLSLTREIRTARMLVIRPETPEP